MVIAVAAAGLEEDNTFDLTAVGREACRELARNNPAAAVLNPVNYVEFIATVTNLTITPGDGSE